MERKPVTSSNIASIGYDKDTQTLEVEFKNNTVFQYFGFEESKFTEFYDAQSSGYYFHNFIKGQYSSKKL